MVEITQNRDMKSFKQRLMNWDLKYSRKIFASDYGKAINFITIAHCCFFMEETFVLTLAILHFLCGQNWSLSIKYLIVLLTNIVVTVITKNGWGRPRPSKAECTCKTKTLFFRNKQSNGSMPSGDAIQAYAMIVFFYYYGTPTMFWTYLIAGTIISMSRVYLCCHYISDIIVGGIIGAIFTIFLIKVGFMASGLDAKINTFSSSVMNQYIY
jgi:membrane-associated phospholipid phosphatase